MPREGKREGTYAVRDRASLLIPPTNDFNIDDFNNDNDNKDVYWQFRLTYV